MKTRLKSALAFALGIILYSVIQTLSGIFVFNETDPGLPPGEALLITLAMAAAAAFIAGLGFGFGLARFHVSLSPFLSAIGGTGFAIVVSALVGIVQAIPTLPVIRGVATFLILFLGALFLPIALQRFVPPAAEPSKQPPPASSPPPP